MVFRRVKKFVKKTAKRGIRYAKKRYTHKGKPKYGQIVKDVMMLKKMVNVEKKAYDNPLFSNWVAQVNINATGATILDLTPYISEGAQSNQRNGKSIKLVAMSIKAQFNAQPNMTTDQRIRVQFFRCTKAGGVPTIDKIYNINTFSTVIDYLSERNPDYFGDYQLLGTKYCRIKRDTFSGQFNYTDLQFSRKMSSHLRWADETAGNHSHGQIFCVLTADMGNYNNSSNSTLSTVQQTGFYTGTKFYLASRFYYIDN